MQTMIATPGNYSLRKILILTLMLAGGNKIRKARRLFELYDKDVTGTIT